MKAVALDIFELTNELVKKYKTRDPFSLASSLGIDVDCADLGSLKGFYIVYSRNRFVVLNTSLTESLSRIILAHEIGHDRLHRSIAENGGLKESSFFDMKSNHILPQEQIQKLLQVNHYIRFYLMLRRLFVKMMIFYH